ncbi:MAG: hypothetical protein FWE44_01150 [Defluviitaleaceae bacterium]|nr:hypothetical protein [Defluviitaleaceae bacterium]
MLCKHCNNIIKTSDGICKNCTRPIRSGKKNLPKYTKIGVIALIFGVCVFFVVMYLTDRVNFDFISNIFSSSTNDTIDSDLPTNTETSNGDQQQNSSVDNGPPLIDEELRRSALSELNTVVTDYLEEFSIHFAFVSNMGYLFNDTDQVFITTQHLVELGLLPQPFLQEDFLILYLRPSDLNVFDEVDLPNENTLTVFVAHETITGIGLYSTHNYTEIFRENLNSVIESYIPYGGSVVRPLSQSVIYQNIVSSIISQNNGILIDVRFMSADGNFAFATVSNVGSSHLLRHYVFEIVDNEPLMLLSGLENQRHPTQVINQAAPNFNPSLLPNFNLTRTNLVQAANFAYLQNIMIENTLIPSGVAPNFIASTNQYTYMVFESYGSFLAAFSSQWVVQPVSGWQHAEDILSDITLPPLYILRQE